MELGSTVRASKITSATMRRGGIMQARACLVSSMNSTIVEISRCAVQDSTAPAPKTVKKAGGVPAQAWARIWPGAPPSNAPKASEGVHKPFCSSFPKQNNVAAGFKTTSVSTLPTEESARHQMRSVARFYYETSKRL